MLKYFLENINRKVTTTEMEKYNLRGTTEIIRDVNRKQPTINTTFSLKTDDDEVMGDFKWNQ